MKILLILPNLPYPLDSGGNQAIFSMISAMQERYETSIITVGSQKRFDAAVQELKALWPDVKFHLSAPYSRWQYPVAEAKSGSKFKIVRYFAESFSRKYFRIKSKDCLKKLDSNNLLKLRTTINENPMDASHLLMYEKIQELHKNEHYDIIQAEFSEFINAAYYLPDDVRKVFVHHEIGFVRRRNEFELMEGTGIGTKALLEKQKDAEIAALRRFDNIIVLTEVDKQILVSEGLDADKIYVSGAVVAGESIEFSPCGNDFVFVGGNSHHPNFDGVLWLKEKVMPILHSRGFEPHIHIVGPWRRQLASRLSAAEPSFIFDGFVEDITAYLNGKISLVPIRIGSGMRMKILDAVTAGSPFITTAKGVEGQNFKNMKDCIICDDAEEFADWMIKLANDKTLQQSLAESAKATLDTRYIPREMVRHRMAFYDKGITMPKSFKHLV